MRKALLNHVVLGKIMRGMNVICLAILWSFGITEAIYASNASSHTLSFAEVLEISGNKVARCLMMDSPAGTGRYFCMYGKRNEGTNQVSLTHRDNTDEGKILIRQRFFPYNKNQIGLKIQSWLCNDTGLCSKGQADEAKQIEVIKTIIISEPLQIENTPDIDKLEDKFTVNKQVLRYELPSDSLTFFTDQRYGELYQFARGVHVLLRSLPANKLQSQVETTKFVECKQTLTDLTQKNSECEQTLTDLTQKNSEYQQQLNEFTQNNKKAENKLSWFVLLMIGLFMIGLILGSFLGFVFLKRKDNSSQNELSQIHQSWKEFSGEKIRRNQLAETLDNLLNAVSWLFKNFPSIKGGTVKDKLTQIVEVYKAQTSQINEQERDRNEQKNAIISQQDEIMVQKDEIGVLEQKLTELKQRESVYASLLFDYFYLPKPQPGVQAVQDWQTEILQHQNIRASLKLSLLREVIACRKAVHDITDKGDAELNGCLTVLEIDKITDYLESAIHRDFDSDTKMFKEGLATTGLHCVFRAVALLQTYYPNDNDLKVLAAHLQTIAAMLRATFVDLAGLNIQFSEPRLLEEPPTDCKQEPDVGENFKRLNAIKNRVTERYQLGGRFLVDIKYYGMSYDNRQHYGMKVIVYNPAWW